MRVVGALYYSSASVILCKALVMFEIVIGGVKHIVGFHPSFGLVYIGPQDDCLRLANQN